MTEKLETKDNEVVELKDEELSTITGGISCKFTTLVERVGKHINIQSSDSVVGTDGTGKTVHTA